MQEIKLYKVSKLGSQTATLHLSSLPQKFHKNKEHNKGQVYFGRSGNY